MYTSPRTFNVNGGTNTPEPDVIILVMGMTGSGKSSFIRLITGDAGIQIGYGVSSQTSEIGVHCWTAPDGRLVALVDTPGFDDSNTDTKVLYDIASFVKERYGKINGLIYCQRIDVWAGGFTIRNLRMFEDFSGLALRNTAIVTTCWDVVGNERALKMEEDLMTREQYFQPLCQAGASTFGHDNTYGSAQRVINMFLDNSGGTERTRPDIIILIMGMTGSGKSSFIRLITGDEKIEIGYGVASQTSEIGAHYWTAPDGRLVALVDTPGFDDSSGMSDTRVLYDIASFLKNTYGKINGLIYFQRIDVRAGGLTIRNLRVFEELCGLALKNTAIVTTCWDVVGNERAQSMEENLMTREQYFQPLCRAGASTFGHDNTHGSAQRVMNMFLNNNGGTPTAEKTLPDVIILIMGMTGSGKSSFIRLVTDDEGIKIGHGVESQTSEIGMHYWTAPDGRLCALVDTPGFDDSNGMTDTDVLRKIADFLKDTYGKINGLIYCQRIDIRAGGRMIGNLRMFEKVCGVALKNAAIVTTHWDVVGDERAVDLERELVTGERYFKPLRLAGATTFGHDDTRASARRVMNMLLNNDPIVLQMQEELTKPGMTLEETAAGSQLSADLDVGDRKREAEVKKVREEMEDAMRANDRAWQKELYDELARLKGDMQRSTASKEQLRQPPSKSGLFERLTHACAEGARQSGVLGMLGGLGGGLFGEGRASPARR